MRRTPVLIVGGGPAGAAAALSLCKHGVRPELVERSIAAHEVVCGGFLSWNALRWLRHLGVDAGSLGAQTIQTARLVGAGRAAEFKLPRPAAGLSRRRLDAALLQAAEEAGAIVARGRAVRAVQTEERLVRMDSGEEIAVRALILATGKHELRGLARRPGSPRDHTAVGIRSAVPATARARGALAGVVELYLFNEGYAGLLLQEDGMINLCLSVSKRRLSEAGGVVPLLDELAFEAPGLLDRIGTDLPTRFNSIAGVPYGWSAADTKLGIFRTGDQAAVTASLVGDGIAIALMSGMQAAGAVVTGGPEAAAAWQKRFTSRSKTPLLVAEAIRAAAESERSRCFMLAVLQRAPGLGSTAAWLSRMNR